MVRPPASNRCEDGGVFATRLNIMDNNERLLSRKQLAERWQMCTETLKRREKLGVLPYMKLGRLVRYRFSDIEDIEQNAEVHMQKLDEAMKRERLASA